MTVVFLNILKVIRNIILVFSIAAFSLWGFLWIDNLANSSCQYISRIGFTKWAPPIEFEDAEYAQNTANEILYSLGKSSIKVTTKRPMFFYFFPIACGAYNRGSRQIWLRQETLNLAVLLHELAHDLNSKGGHGKSFYMHYATLLEIYGSATFLEIIAALGPEKIDRKWTRQRLE